MSSPSPSPETRFPVPPAGAARRPEREAPSGAPRWVKVSGMAAAALALLFAIVHLAGGGLHGHLSHSADPAPSSDLNHHQRPRP